MARSIRLVALASCALLASSWTAPLPAKDRDVRLAFTAVGLNEHQAAAFLLDRLTFGPEPGQVDAVVAYGLERWVADQLAASLPEARLDEKLAPFPATRVTHRELFEQYPSNSLLQAHVRRFYDMIPPAGTPVDFTWVSRRIDAYRTQQGLKRQEIELRNELVGQKVMRARYSQNQLREVLTDFWFNHFYSTPTHFRARPWIVSYENDAMRANALGKFDALLLASAKHPAMRDLHADGAEPAAYGRDQTTLGNRISAARKRGDAVAVDAQVAQLEHEIEAMTQEENELLERQFWPKTGPNRSYARVLLEQHTLGSQTYSTEDLDGVARALTGWTTLTRGPTQEWFTTGLTTAEQFGFVQQDSFLFRADWHDATGKRVFGRSIKAGGGLEEGEQVLLQLAKHPDTATHIARKLAVRFVDETPPERLVTRLAHVFTSTHGDIAATLQTLIESREFWKAAAERTKLKTPFEYAISAVRIAGADVENANGIIDWSARMGQQIYGQVGPIGFPDRNEFWLNAATLTSRMNFANALGAGQVSGVVLAPQAPSDVSRYVATLIPGRDVSATAEALRDASATDLFGLVIAAPQFQLR